MEAGLGQEVFPAQSGGRGIDACGHQDPTEGEGSTCDAEPGHAFPLPGLLFQPQGADWPPVLEELK